MRYTSRWNMTPKREALDSNHFLKTLNSTYEVELGGQEPLTIELFRIDERHDSPRVDQFSLLFRGPMSPWLPQATYRLRNGQIGEIALFLVPVGPEEGRMIYQAAFNRLREPAAK